MTHYGPNYGFSPAGKGRAALDWVKNTNDSRAIKAMVEMDVDTILCQGLNTTTCAVPVPLLPPLLHPVPWGPHGVLSLTIPPAMIQARAQVLSVIPAWHLKGWGPGYKKILPVGVSYNRHGRGRVSALATTKFETFPLMMLRWAFHINPHVLADTTKIETRQQRWTGTGIARSGLNGSGQHGR